MVIVKELEWTREYIESVRHLIPKLRYVKRLSSKKGSRDRWRHCHGIINYHDKTHYRICIYVTYHDMPTDRIRHYSAIDTLTVLADELAHLVHWEHTPAHKVLECTILMLFMNKLSESGYTSEEAELKGKR